MSTGIDIFSDIFARRDNVLSRLDPRVKLILALLTIAFVISSESPAFPGAVSVFSLSAMLALGIPVSWVALRLAGPLGLAAVLLILQSVLEGGTPLWTLDLDVCTISVTREGTALGLLAGVRVLGAVVVILLLSFVTPAHRIFHSLLWLRVPKGWVEIAILMYRYVFGFGDLVADTMAAQRLRLGCLGIRESLASMGRVTGMLIIRSVEQAIQTHDAMTLRGYHGHIPFGPMPPLTCKDLAVFAAAGLSILGSFAFCGKGLD